MIVDDVIMLAHVQMIRMESFVLPRMVCTRTEMFLFRNKQTDLFKK